MLRTFGSCAAEAAEVVKNHSEVLSSHIECAIIACEDEKLSGTFWKPTSHANALERRILEPKRSLCYKGAVMRYTACNTKEGQSHGRLCVVENLPTAVNSPITVLVAPGGVRSIPLTDAYTPLRHGFYRTQVCFKFYQAHKMGYVCLVIAVFSKSKTHSSNPATFLEKPFSQQF